MPCVSQVEEFYVITWESSKEQIFEMPTGGAAMMRQGPNLLKLARKEQCLALVTQLRTKYKTDACFYRVTPDGKVTYMHPADGVYPEKVNAGRVGVNCNMRRIGQNVNPIKVRGAVPGGQAHSGSDRVDACSVAHEFGCWGPARTCKPATGGSTSPGSQALTPS